VEGRETQRRSQKKILGSEGKVRMTGRGNSVGNYPGQKNKKKIPAISRLLEKTAGCGKVERRLSSLRRIGTRLLRQAVFDVKRDPYEKGQLLL